MKSDRNNIIVNNDAVIDLLRTSMARGASFSFRAGGYSMSPFIKDGDMVTVSPFGNTLPGRGDIIAFLNTATNSLTLHRLIKTQGIEFIMKGDNSLSADRPVGETRLLGRITVIKRGKVQRHLGLGSEKKMLAGLSRVGILTPLLRIMRLILLPLMMVIRKSQKTV